MFRLVVGINNCQQQNQKQTQNNCTLYTAVGSKCFPWASAGVMPSCIEI